MLTLRLDKSTESEIEKMSRIQGISKSDLLRKCIKEYILNHKKPSLSEAGRKIFGKYSFKNKNLSVDSEKILRKHFQK